MCLDGAEDIRKRKPHSYDAWHERTTELRRAAEYAAEQREPLEDELVKEYKDRRGT